MLLVYGSGYGSGCFCRCCVSFFRQMQACTCMYYICDMCARCNIYVCMLCNWAGLMDGWTIHRERVLGIFRTRVSFRIRVHIIDIGFFLTLREARLRGCDRRLLVPCTLCRLHGNLRLGTLDRRLVRNLLWGLGLGGLGVYNYIFGSAQSRTPSGALHTRSL